MYKVFISGLTDGPMCCLAECTNKIAALSTAIEFLRLINVNGQLIVMPDPDLNEESIIIETVPVLQSKNSKKSE